MNETIPQRATIRIECNRYKGTATLFFPRSNPDYVYVLTAKHCLAGKEFDKAYSFENIILEQIFNPVTGAYHSCKLTETDVIVVSDNTKDIALIIMPKQRILALTGTEFDCLVVDTDISIKDYLVRGFASFNEQKADRLFELKYEEDQKDNKNLFLLRSDTNLDTFYNKALDNVEGLSGSGVFARINGSIHLVGILHVYEDGNIFIATKVVAFNEIIDSAKFPLLQVVKPETDMQVVHAFQQMDLNREAINRRTHDLIGLIHIPRDITRLRNMLFTHRMAVVHGGAGVGKSVLAKSLVAELMAQSGVTVITFSPEHLYCESLTEALTKSGYHADMERILTSPLSGSRVVIWIESFEKLIESGQSGAFKELLGYIRNRAHLNILVTIRDYTLQKFKINYRFELPEGEIYYTLDVFNEQEISTVRSEMPAIVSLLDNPKIHDLLRTPYYLDKAVRIHPELLSYDGLDESTFKRLMWEHIVEAGLPDRGRAFLGICLKRAREMSLFTVTDVPSEIVAALLSDNLLQEERTEIGNRFSPSHDILEDWALIRYIKQKHQESESPLSFISSLEASPAIVRAFRLWLDEYYRSEPKKSAAFAQKILMDVNTDQEWKDVLLTATLRSAHAGILLDTMSEQLFENDGWMFRQVLRLLQTGCKTFDPKRKDFDQLVPVGSGWDYMIQLIWKNHGMILSLKGGDFIFLSVIESWGNQLPNFNPVSLPPAAAGVAFLLEDCICRFQHVMGANDQEKQNNSMLKKHLGLLLKLSGAAPELVSSILQAAVDLDKEHPRWKAKVLLKSIRQYVVGGILSDQLCKYFPDEIIRIAQEDWKQEGKVPTRERTMSMLGEQWDINDFGIGEGLDNKFDLASGFQTFLYWMLIYHPDKALDFLMPFLNSAFVTNWKIRASVPKMGLSEIIIVFSDSTTRKYFGCYEYWGMFRGDTSGNRLITSLLMALEKALLDISDTDRRNYPIVQKLIKRLINESNNVAILGLVSSIMQAHPDLVDELSVCLLGVKELFIYDIERSHNDFIPRTYMHKDPFLQNERKLEGRRLHRRKYYQGMVEFVAYYMFFYRKHNKQLFVLVDAMWANQGDKEDYWRKYLFDMDARKYAASLNHPPGYENMAKIVPGYDEKVIKMISSNPVEPLPAANIMWIKKVFDREAVLDKSYAVWKTGYEYVQTHSGIMRSMVSSGTLAVIGLRDFEEDLQPEEKDWCLNELFRYAEDQLKPKDYSILDFGKIDVQETMEGFSYILKANFDDKVKMKAKGIVFRLLLSKMDERGKVGLAAGMTQYLADSYPQFLRDCWYGILVYLARVERLANARRGRLQLGYVGNFPDEEDDPQRLDDLVQSVVEGTIQASEHVHITLRTSTEWLLNDALRIIPLNTVLPLHYEYIQQLLRLHINYLSDKTMRSRFDYYLGRHAFTFFYARYLLSQPQDLAADLFVKLADLTLTEEQGMDSVETASFVYNLIQEHIRAVNSGFSISNFWALWEQLRIFMLKNSRAYLMPLFMMDIKWNDEVEQWNVLDGKSLYYQEFITRYGHTKIDISIKFLSGIAFHNFMPDSVSWVKRMLSAKDVYVFDDGLVEQFVLKAFYSYGAEIKGDKTCLMDFIFILEILIIKGSSKAYMLKEELIQYKQIE